MMEIAKILAFAVRRIGRTVVRFPQRLETIETRLAIVIFFEPESAPDRGL
jgi:hypothetical protein